MFTTMLFLLALDAATANPVPPPLQGSQTTLLAQVAPEFPADSTAAEAAYEEREFIRHVDGLSRALNDFAVTYKSGLVDLKKVKAVRKALHELEKSEWFRHQKAK